MAGQPTVLYVCGNCFSVDEAPGKCPNCQRERIKCDLGDPDNPCRRPPMDAEGHLRSRAPLWWLVHSAPYLRAQLEKEKSSRH